MKQLKTSIRVFLCLNLIAAFATACGPPKTITDEITEIDFNQEENLCQDHGLAADFKPGKIICSGEYEGKQLVVEIVAEVVDGTGRFKILRFSEDGVDVASENFSYLNDRLAEDTFIPEEGYMVTSIIITDDELSITRSLK